MQFHNVSYSLSAEMFLEQFLKFLKLQIYPGGKLFCLKSTRLLVVCVLVFNMQIYLRLCSLPGGS